jgi:uncharacterized membrane protein
MVLTNPQANIHEIGFITREDLLEHGIDGKVAVYLPMSYSLSGRLVLVDKSQVTSLNMDAAEAMKFAVSGGVTDKD